VVDKHRGKITSCRLEVVETPRFFEALLQGRHYRDVATIVSRVCGVCSISHTLASLMATEAALGVACPPQAQLLRRLLSYGEIAQSHLLQLYFMAVPDHLGALSLFQLIDRRRDLVARALRLKRVANRICELVGGRPIHPVTCCIGGFLAKPEASQLKQLRQELVAALPDLEATVELFAGFSYPEFHRKREALSLQPETSYPLHGRNLLHSNGERFPVEDYRLQIEEYLVPYSTAKLARSKTGSYMVGSQARIRHGFPRLSPMAQKVATALDLDSSGQNPYENLKARLVEVIHYFEEAMHAIDALLMSGMTSIFAKSTPARFGQGTAVVEAPRGLLFHSYDYSAAGLLQQADCVIPTAQNLACLEADMQALLPDLLDQPDEQLKLQLEMLIRSYDPCLSCSTHLLKIDLC